MVFEGIKFPLYRKYKNERHFFKVISATEFEEIQQVGTRYLFHRINASKLPEMNQIYDLVYNAAAFGSEISENEYIEIKSRL